MSMWGIDCPTSHMGNLPGHLWVRRFMVVHHPSLFLFLLRHLHLQVKLSGYHLHQRVLLIRKISLQGPSSPLSWNWLP